MVFGFGQVSDTWSDEPAPSAPITHAPGKRTLTSRLAPRAHAERAPAPAAARPVQADGGLTLDDPFALHTIASRGVAGGGGPLPHLATIQASFGHHDVGGVRAHVGGAAAEAAAAIGARAYATGDAVAFAADPDLRQAAHEAAHVVQQRGGVRLDGGVGKVGDIYEQHADAVADAVVRGVSAEALLDPMAHRGAAGGPAVQRLVAERDGVAVGRLQRLLSDATPAEVMAIRRELQTRLDASRSVVFVAVDLDFIHRGEEYRLHLPIADARAMLAECEAAAAHARTRPARRTAARREARHLTSFGAAALGAMIRTLGGTEGEETEVECTVRVPIPETPLCVTGGIAMTVGHEAAGWKVEFAPQLGLGLIEGEGHMDLVTTHTSEVTGHTPELAAELLGVALEHEIRAMGDGAPPPFVLAALAAASTVAPFAVATAVVADLGARIYNWATTGHATDPFFVWLANAIFGEGHMAAVGRRMRDGDAVETTDGGEFAAEGGEGTGHSRSEAGVHLGAGRHWSMAREGGATHEAEWTSLDVEFEAEVHGFTGKFELHVPVTRGDHVPTGEIAIELGASVETHSVQTVIVADLFARAAQLVLRAIASRSGTEEARRRAQHTIDVAGELASGARSILAARAVAGGAGSEIGVVLALTFHLGRGEPNTMAVKITDGFEGDVAAQEVEYTHARTIGEVPF